MDAGSPVEGLTDHVHPKAAQLDLQCRREPVVANVRRIGDDRVERTGRGIQYEIPPFNQPEVVVRKTAHPRLMQCLRIQLGTEKPAPAT